MTSSQGADSLSDRGVSPFWVAGWTMASRLFRILLSSRAAPGSSEESNQGRPRRLECAASGETPTESRRVISRLPGELETRTEWRPAGGVNVMRVTLSGSVRA